jgi:hypothetical protein
MPGVLHTPSSKWSRSRRALSVISWELIALTAEWAAITSSSGDRCSRQTEEVRLETGQGNGVSRRLHSELFGASVVCLTSRLVLAGKILGESKGKVGCIRAPP